MFPGQITNSSNANIYAIFGSEIILLDQLYFWCLAFSVLKHFSRQLLSYTSSRAYSYFEYMLS